MDLVSSSGLTLDSIEDVTTKDQECVCGFSFLELETYQWKEVCFFVISYKSNLLFESLDTERLQVSPQGNGSHVRQPCVGFAEVSSP